jgi:hypothetical protein
MTTEEITVKNKENEQWNIEHPTEQKEYLKHPEVPPDYPMADKVNEYVSVIEAAILDAPAPQRANLRRFLIDRLSAPARVVAAAPRQYRAVKELPHESGQGVRIVPIDFTGTAEEFAASTERPSDLRGDGLKEAGVTGSPSSVGTLSSDQLR